MENLKNIDISVIKQDLINIGENIADRISKLPIPKTFNIVLTSLLDEKIKIYDPETFENEIKRIINILNNILEEVKKSEKDTPENTSSINTLKELLMSYSDTQLFVETDRSGFLKYIDKILVSIANNNEINTIIKSGFFTKLNTLTENNFIDSTIPTLNDSNIDEVIDIKKNLPINVYYIVNPSIV